MFQRRSWWWLVLAARLGNGWTSLRWYCFGMKVWLRTAETWHYASPGKAIGEGVALVVVEGPGLMGSGKDVEAWLHGRAYERLLVKVQLSYRRGPHILELSVLSMATKNSSHSEVESAGASKTGCVCYRGQSQRSQPRPLEEPRKLWVDPRYWMVRILLCFDWIVLPWFFPRAHSWETWNFKKRLEF